MQPRRPLEQGRSASAPNLCTGSPREEATYSHDPPTYEEGKQSLGRAPIQQDLGPFSPISLSSSLVPYEDDSPSTPEEEEQQPVMEERMEDEGGDIVAEETIMKEHEEAKAEYVPKSPQYMPANEDEEEEMSSDEDIEAPYLAPKSVNTTPPNKDLRAGYYAVSKEDQPTQPPASESSGEDSFPDLINLQEAIIEKTVITL